MRTTLARKQVETFATQEVGTVVAAIAIGGRPFRVRTGSGEHDATRAVSCLVEPEVGDRVLLAIHDAGCHVLAVLDREGSQPTRIVAPGDVEISAPSGRFTVAAQDGVRLVSPGEVAVASGKVRVASTEGSLAVGTLTYLGDQVVAQVDRVTTVAKQVESVAERWVQRVKRAYRFVAESEQVQAKYLGYSATAAMTVKAKTTVVSSGDLTKIDGAQIHLG